jgi:hypothetical protein
VRRCPVELDASRALLAQGVEAPRAGHALQLVLAAVAELRAAATRSRRVARLDPLRAMKQERLRAAASLRGERLVCGLST